MKILFVSPPMHPSTSGGVGQPLGILSVASQIVHISPLIDVSIIDANLNGYSVAETVNQIVKKSPNILCLTMSTPSANSVLSVIRNVKEALPSVKTVVGGIHATIYAEYISSLPYIDLVVKGEGEQAVGDILSSKKGVVSKGAVGNLDSIWPSDWSLVDVHRYTNTLIDNSFAMVMASRGCPYSCTFCSAHIICGKKPRYRSFEHLARELNQLVALNVHTLIFQDDIFTLNAEHTIFELLRSWRKRGKRHSFDWWCNMRADLVTDRILDRMKNGGCVGICVGIESGNQDILNAMRKGITLKQIRDGVTSIHRAGLKTYGYFMIGNLDDTVETTKQTISLAKSLPLDYAQFSICTPFPGSELYGIARERGIIVDDLDWSLFDWERDPPNVSKMTSEERKVWREKAIRKFYFTPRRIIKHFNWRDFLTGMRLLR